MACSIPLEAVAPEIGHIYSRCSCCLNNYGSKFDTFEEDDVSCNMEPGQKWAILGNVGLLYHEQRVKNQILNNANLEIEHTPRYIQDICMASVK